MNPALLISEYCDWIIIVYQTVLGFRYIYICIYFGDILNSHDRFAQPRKKDQMLTERKRRKEHEGNCRQSDLLRLKKDKDLWEGRELVLLKSSKIVLNVGNEP